MSWCDDDDDDDVVTNVVGHGSYVNVRCFVGSLNIREGRPGKQSTIF